MQPHRVLPLQSHKGDRPPQVVSRSSHKHGFQDFLVPSIESVTSDVVRPLVPTEERYARPESFDHLQGPYPREVIESRRLSPPQRQFIVLDDDSTQNKRRRVYHEEDSGHYRPVLSHDYGPSSFSDSRLQPSSLPHKRTSPGPRTSQNVFSSGMSGTPNPSHATTSGKSIPIYDAPDPSYVGRPPEHFRRTEVYDSTQSNGGTVMHHLATARPANSAGELYHHRPVYGSRAEGAYSPRPGEPIQRSRYVDADYRPIPRRSQSPPFPVQSRVSRSYEIDAGRDVMDQTFIQNFSQSRINGSVHVRKEYTDRPPDGPISSATDVPGSRHVDEEYGRRPFPVPVSTRTRSPVRYIERPR